MPYIGDLVDQTSMIFVNAHYSYSGPKPLSPSVIELGGIHIKDAKPLEESLQKVLDSAKDGVIYVSWGSMIRAESLPIEKRKSLLEAFGSFKQTVLWKWENETLPDQPKNVVIRKWMPQRDILCTSEAIQILFHLLIVFLCFSGHPNVRVFVSHGGLMGSSEGAYCGVPMVLTPMYGDQFLNSAAAVNRGMGTIVHFEDISAETMKAAITEALKPQSRQNAKKVSYSYQNRPRKPIETAVWWVEYIAATQGGPLLQSHSSKLSTIAYYSFDVYAIIAAVILTVIASWIFLVCKCFKRISCEKKAKSE